jgi:hypothetical protein
MVVISTTVLTIIRRSDAEARNRITSAVLCLWCVIAIEQVEKEPHYSQQHDEIPDMVADTSNREWGGPRRSM